MNRYFLAAVIALITLGAWLARPGAAAAAADAPVMVDIGPAEAIGQIHALPLQNAFKREPIAGDFEAFASGLTLKHDESGARREIASLWSGDEKVLIIRIDVRRDGSQTAVDVATDLPASALTRQKVLRADDRRVLAVAADLAVTDYLASMLRTQPLADSHSLQQAADAAAGFDDVDHKAFARRVSQAVGLAFGAAPAVAAEAPQLASADEEAPADEDPGSADLAAPDPDVGVPDEPKADEPRGTVD